MEMRTKKRVQISEENFSGKYTTVYSYVRKLRCASFMGAEKEARIGGARILRCGSYALDSLNTKNWSLAMNHRLLWFRRWKCCEKCKSSLCRTQDPKTDTNNPSPEKNDSNVNMRKMSLPGSIGARSSVGRRQIRKVVFDSGLPRVTVAFSS